MEALLQNRQGDLLARLRGATPAGHHEAIRSGHQGQRQGVENEEAQRCRLRGTNERPNYIIWLLSIERTVADTCVLSTYIEGRR